MLGKLLKYEMKASARTLLPLYAGTLIVATLCSIQMMLSFQKPNDTLVWLNLGDFTANDTISGLLFLLFFGLCVAITVLTIIIVIQRFNNSLVGNEGYLMFTLPATHVQLLGSKLMGAMLWSIIGVIVMFFSLIIISASGILLIWDTVSWSGVCSQLMEILKNIMPMMLSSTVFTFISLVATILLVYLSIMIAQTERFNNHRVIVAVVLFFVLSWFFAAVNTFVFQFLSEATLFHIMGDFIDNYNQVLIVSTAFEMVKCVTCFTGTIWLMKKKLNL